MAPALDVIPDLRLQPPERFLQVESFRIRVSQGQRSVVGSVLPLAAFALVRPRSIVLRNVTGFIAGFCLIANGAYISIGWIDQVGDCGEMLRTGTPVWAMLAFGGVTIPLGLFLWHSLGSIKHFIDNPPLVSRRLAYSGFSVLIVVVAVELMFSPR
jgi:hypothetical protein